MAFVLNYGAQPAAAQSGNAVVLEYAPAAAQTTVRAGCRVPWAAGQPAAHRLQARVAAVVTRDGAHRIRWAVASRQQSRWGLPWGVAAVADRTVVAPWAQFSARRAHRLPVVWGVAAHADRRAVAPWGVYAQTPAVSAVPSWGRLRPYDLAAVLPWVPRVSIVRPLVASYLQGKPLNPGWVLPWVRYSRPLNPGWGVVIGDGNPPTDGAGTVIVPVLEYYLVINEFSLVRADDASLVQARQFAANIDADSWTWNWSAALPASELDAVRATALGEQVELIASLNGNLLRLVVERISRERRFGDGWIRASGRGRAAWLADPYAAPVARSNSQARTARQILEDALTINNVSIGWEVDWRITDWLVPAGAWNHQGTYIDAATRIAEAGGAYIQSHATDQTLIVMPRYPVAPWGWSGLTPDIELPEDVIEVEGLEWTDRPAYNAVYVTGGATGGRHDRILRTGSAADRLAPEIVDPLATAPEMTRQRGTVALSDVGRQAHITLRLPVLPETGLITPGKLIRYVEGGNVRRGLSRSISIEHDFPQLWQTVQVETHELESV